MTGAAPDGRLNCTVIISSDDQIATLAVQEGTLVTDTGKNPVPEIHITPVNPAEISSGSRAGWQQVDRACLSFPARPCFF